MLVVLTQQIPLQQKSCCKGILRRATNILLVKYDVVWMRFPSDTSVLLMLMLFR